ncbi:MAG: M23 family metallopeptidase [Cyanobacteria bacterium P01_A01_bin.114]
MPTWIKETDQAFYLMDGNFYIDKLQKQPRPTGVGEAGEKTVFLDKLRTWLTQLDEPPGAMVIATCLNAEEPTARPTIEITQKPDAVMVGEEVIIKGRMPAYVGDPIDLYAEVGGVFYLQTRDPAKKPKVQEDGTFDLRFRFFSPGNRRLKLEIGPLSEIFAVTVRAGFRITNIPSSATAGEVFNIVGSAPLDDVGKVVQLFVDDRLQPSSSKVQSNGTWRIRFGLYGLGNRRLKLVVGISSETKVVKIALRSIFPNFTVPERQLRRETGYPTTLSPVIGSVTFTGGFMEPHGHSFKSTKYAIFDASPNRIQTLPSSDRNLGVDYVVTTSGKPIRNWYPGRVTQVGNEGGYGLRCHVAFAYSYVYGGRSYPVRGAYAHAASFSVKVGDFVKQGQTVGVMGNTGASQGPHVDFRLWIYVNGRIIDLSPNAFEAHLRKVENN